MKKNNQGYTYKIIEAKLVISGSTTSDALKSPTSISAANLLKRDWEILRQRKISFDWERNFNSC